MSLKSSFTVAALGAAIDAKWAATDAAAVAFTRMVYNSFKRS